MPTRNDDDSILIRRVRERTAALLEALTSDTDESDFIRRRLQQHAREVVRARARLAAGPALPDIQDLLAEPPEEPSLVPGYSGKRE
ncbi:hypothetical protein DP939_13440 [Spongiactinospora rosea]|uniref:Uncharacterized protein n=1 Tax=Spongiactinospora rosea TaxID=2248750 RepID=A0A366M0K3_9ACTN|nr:hypothetical protein [Spongiactinospora rosea]RBQ19725.1 hypothetical protein DP939_13440 [Spongiactinospora rosea]